jgi:transcriptional regulator of heat shock response
MPKKKIDVETGLSTRQRNLLFAVIKEYCEFGVTVSSQDLKEKYGFDVSPATIRNEFTKLRDMGFLYQPFTNSSSQPTEKAFKVFINQMMTGLQVTTRQQHELRKQIAALENKQTNLQKELSRLLAFETQAVGFAANFREENVSGMKNLLTESNSKDVESIIDFLEHLDTNKKYLLESKQNKTSDKNFTNINTNLATVFGDDNPIFQLGKGYGIISAKAKVNNEDIVFGVITRLQVIGRKKTMQIMNAISQILNESDETK